MNKSIKYLLVAVAAMGMASCSTGRYVNNSQNVNLSQTQVVLSQANFQVVKQVKVTYVYTRLRTIKFDAEQLKESAYAALVKEAKLTGAQTIINVTMEQVQRVRGFYFKKYQQAITVSGTVIEFLPAGVTPTNSDVVESYLYGDPLVGDINRINATTNAAMSNVTTYHDQIKQKYAAKDAQFLAIYEQVKNYLLSNKRDTEMAKIEKFLLTGSQKDINALKSEVSHNKKLDAQINIFIKYACMN